MSAAVTHETQPAHCSTVVYAARVETANEQFTVERQPSVSCVDTDRQAADSSQQFEQSEQPVFESNPTADKTDVISTTKVENACRGRRGLFSRVCQ